MKDLVEMGQKVLVKITTGGEMSIHTIPMDWTEAQVDAMADDLLDTEGATKHDLGEDDTGVMRTVIYCYNQSYQHLLSHNKPLTDGLMEGLNTLVMLKGDALVALSPSWRYGEANMFAKSFMRVGRYGMMRQEELI